MAKHQVYASLEGIKKNMWRSNLQGFFEINGRPLSDSEVRKLIEYGISKGYKDNSCFTDEDIEKIKMKHKVGDKVRIKSIEWYNENKDRLGYINLFTRMMSKYCGKEAIITNMFSRYYSINLDCELSYWSDDMFED